MISFPRISDQYLAIRLVRYQKVRKSQIVLFAGFEEIYRKVDKSVVSGLMI
jgi:hypothetical protein